MTSPDDLTAYTHLADDLFEEATKNQLAYVAQLLALNTFVPIALRTGIPGLQIGRSDKPANAERLRRIRPDITRRITP